MTEWNVRARRWEHGWELHVEGAGVTQSRTLGDAETMVRDYIESLHGHSTEGDTVVVRPDLGGPAS